MSSRYRALLPVAAVAALGMGTFVLSRPRSPAGGAPAQRRDLLLITLDTARADRFGCYGYAPAKTRHIDRLVAEGVRFEQARRRSRFRRIFTGLYPLCACCYWPATTGSIKV